MEDINNVDKAEIIEVLEKQQSPIDLSPMLDDDEIEVKAYTTNNNFNNQSDIEPETQNIKVDPKSRPFDNDNGQQQNKGQYFDENNRYIAADENLEDDNLEEHHVEHGGTEFDENGGEPLSADKANLKAIALLQGYNAMIPPLISKGIKQNPADARYLMSYNKVPNKEIQEVEKTLKNTNKQIETTLKLSKDEINLLKEPLSAVIQKYNVTSDNPLVNLGTMMLGIGIGKFIAIKEVMKEQKDHLEMIIDGFKLKMPNGFENYPHKKSTTKIKDIKGGEKVQEAA